MLFLLLAAAWSDHQPCSWDAEVVSKPFCGNNGAASQADPAVNFNPCRGTTNASRLPFCNPQLSINNRVKDLLQRLTLDEKIIQLTTGNGVNGGLSDNSVPRLGIPK